MEQKPERKYLKLKVENNRTYEVDDFILAEFIAAVEKRKPVGLEGGSSKSGVEPVDAKLYPVPDNSRFLESVVENLKRFKPAMDAEKKNASCDNKTKRAKFAHQEVLAAYFTLQNPYRGILIYHGMGSGKTCSSVAMAENLAGNQKPIWVLTPKALEANYRAEMVKCSKIYQQSQHWVARKQGWVVLKGRPPNFDELGPQEQQEVSAHLKSLMDREKAYRFVSYSGMSCQNIRAQFTAENNPFDNSIVVVDEVHLLVELIAKNLADNSSPFPLLYEWLLDAEGCRVIALSGTPRAHKLTDLGVLFNLVYGYLKVWTVHTPKLIEDPKMKRFIHQQRSVGKKLEVTRTPYGFEANYDEASGALLGLHKVDDTWDEHKFRTEMSKFGVVGDRVEKHKLLPDKDGVFVDEEVFQRRIQGLTSYFPDLGNLMPKLLPRRVHEVALSELQAKETKTYLLHFPKDVHRIVRRPLDACQTSSAEDPRYTEDIRKTIVALKEKGVFKDGLDTYGPKIKEVVKHALAGSARQLVYTAELENAFFLAEALIEKGYTQLMLTPPSPPEQMGWAVIQAKDPAKAFVLYNGSPAELEVMVETFNKGGARLFLASAAGVEGISLADVADVHIVEPSVDPTKLLQVVGRARRMCKNTDVEGVTPHVYLSGKHEKTVYEEATKHQEEIDRWLELIKETAVDCALHRSKCFSATKGTKNETKRKRIKMDVNGEARHFYVDVTHGEQQPMYKAAEGLEKYGFVSFGPPHVFYNDEKEKVKPSEIIS